MAADLGPIIRQTDQAKGHSHPQDNPDKAIIKPRPKQRGQRQRRKDQQAPHRGRACLGCDMMRRPIFANGLSLGIAAAQRVDQRAAKDKAKDQRREKRGPCTEGDIAEQVKEVAAI